METEIWINGEKVFYHPYGYTSFFCNIDQYCKHDGEKNIVAVKVTNRGKNSRWYSGSGIYRNVHLTVTDPVHVSVWGAYVTTTAVSAASADVNLQINIQNDADMPADASVSVRIFTPGETVAGNCEGAVKLAANGSGVFSNTVSLKDPTGASAGGCPARPAGGTSTPRGAGVAGSR